MLCRVDKKSWNLQKYENNYGSLEETKKKVAMKSNGGLKATPKSPDSCYCLIILNDGFKYKT